MGPSNFRAQEEWPAKDQESMTREEGKETKGKNNSEL